MDHSYIEENQIADLYLLGKLSNAEQIAFEEHFVDCADCLDRLETIQELRAGLQDVSAEEAALKQAATRAGLGWYLTVLALVARRSRWRRAGLLAVIIIITVLPAFLLVSHWRNQRRELAEARQAASEWRTRYEESEQNAQNLLKEVQVREQQQNQLAARLESERGLHDRLLERTSRSVGAAVPVFELGLERSGKIDRVAIPLEAKFIILYFVLDPDSALQSYRAAIMTADGRTVWKKDKLIPSSEGGLALGMNANLFNQAVYWLEIEGLTEARSYVPVAQYPFRVLNK